MGEPSQGRVIAYEWLPGTGRFRGHLVTVVGPITTGVEAGKIGQTPYDFVVMNALQVTGVGILEQQVLMPPMMDPWGYRHPGMWGPGWGGGWYNPGQHRYKLSLR